MSADLARCQSEIAEAEASTGDLGTVLWWADWMIEAAMIREQAKQNQQDKSFSGGDNRP